MADAGAELVSVVIPSRNRRAGLERAIESVSQQTWPNIEIIVVDDASSDDTPELRSRWFVTKRHKAGRAPGIEE